MAPISQEGGFVFGENDNNIIGRLIISKSDEFAQPPKV
jgi:hypothetical protein